MIRSKGAGSLPISDGGQPAATPEVVSFDDKRRTELFLKDQIPTQLACSGYVAVAVISVATLPHIFPQLKWYYVLVAYVFTPVLAFYNAYGCGLTDWSLASTHGKLAIFTIGAWAGANHGGVLAGLAACGVMTSIVATASDLMQDFKTGYLTLASPISFTETWQFLELKALAPCQSTASLSAASFFALAITINLVRDLSPKKVARFIPLPMAMAIPFYLGSYFAIDMCVGSLVLFVWERINKAKADAFAPAVASGLICGDGICTLPQSVLALAKVKPPICMKFLKRRTNDKVDAFLSTLTS